MAMPAPLMQMTDPIRYVTVLAADRPRAIDAYIDYFGESPRRPDLSRPRPAEIPAR